MSIEAIQYVTGISGLSASERCVLWDLASHHNVVKGVAWPSVKTLAAKLDLSARRIQQILTRLVELGHIAKVRRGTRTAYTFPHAHRTIDGKVCEKAVSSCGSEQLEAKPISPTSETSFAAIRKETVFESIELQKQEQRQQPAATPVQNQKILALGETQSQITPEQRRRLALTNSRRLGLRDFKTYPLEAWEGPLKSWEIQKRKRVESIRERAGFRSITKSDLLKAAAPCTTAK